MKRLARVLGAMAVASALTAAGAGQAAVINWTITGGTFLLDVPDDYGPDATGTFSGTFSYNTVTGTFEAWAVQTASDPYALPLPPFGDTYTSASPGHTAANDGPGPHFTTPFVGDLSLGHSSDLRITNLDPGAAASLSALTGSETFLGTVSGSQMTFTRTITGGGAVGVLAIAGVPEPATWALVIVGFGAAGVALRRGRAVAS